ncbi:MAG: response regulator [Lachnospiraceae bacterium]|nr:response regulator [Lachnospiraceae bacterium]
MKKILVVDNDILKLKMAEYILKQSGYETVTAVSGREGIERLKEGGIDLLLLDIEMPGMSGIEVLSEIRDTPDIADTKVMFLTGAGGRRDMTEAIRLGALDFVQKPVFPGELIDRIKRALLVDHKDVVLVVDDEPMNRMLTKRIFDIRYQVECVASGTEALAFLKRRKPDIILLDYHMPDMNGLQMMEQMHEMKDCADIPVVFLTADHNKNIEVEIFKAGARDYIQKPFVAQVALQRINRILELKHLQDSLQDEVDKKTAELKESHRKIKNLSRQIMYAMTGAIDAKDAYTNGHSNRVADYSRELAVRMGKTPQEVEDVYYAALLHDVGKIGVANDIINKPGRLTDEEYEIIKGHTVMGAKILENISELPLLSVGAHWHHVRYDGKGYPDGLAGEDIPEIARIVCVADCYDAMSSFRSYRDALPQEVVRSEIEKGRGTQFDPEIAELMLQMIDEDIRYDMREKRKS